jgi:2-aminoadipate transaminase
MFWDQHYAQRTHNIKSSAIRELLKVTELPEVISFAGGLPAPEVFPVEEVSTITQQVLKERSTQALQYGPTEGYGPLRELLAHKMSQNGLHVSVENVLITSGSQQALDLLGKILLNPGEHILVENPTYMGALQAWSSYEPAYIAVRSDECGIVLEEVEAILRQRRPKYMYIQPNFQNPGGVSLTLERRKRLVELANHYSIPIVEDDPYGELRFEGSPLPSLLEIDGITHQQTSYQGHVIHLNTFSKILAPGLRLGWVTAPAEVINKLVQAKQGADLQAGSLNQLIAYEMLQQGIIERHIPLIRDVYRQRRDAMLTALQDYFPADITWTHPTGGLFLWITLPEGMDATTLLQNAMEYKVAFVPGADFHANGGGENTLRLNFSNASPEKIHEGIMRLGKLLAAQLANSLA